MILLAKCGRSAASPTAPAMAGTPPGTKRERQPSDRSGVDLYQGATVRRALAWAIDTGARPMTHISQHIHDAFPGDADIITRLKTESGHFRNLAAQFDVIDHEAAEAADTATDARTEALKKRRLALLDEMAVVIDQNRAV
jgi:uncharacterized protein YdcH (DUF465 family)